MPDWLTKRIGCTEIETPLKHIPIKTVLGKYFCNTISIVPVFGEVNTSPNSNFIILSFDLIQCNPSIETEIKLNERGSAIQWVRLTFPALNNLSITIEFTGRTLIADADDLINALRDLNLISLDATTPTKIDKSSLTSYLDRFLTGHLTKYPEDTARMMTDQEVIRL